MTSRELHRTSVGWMAVLCACGLSWGPAQGHAADAKDPKGVGVETHGAGEMKAVPGSAAAATKAPQQQVTAQEIRELAAMATDPGQAAVAVVRIRARLENPPSAQFETFLRRLLVRALIESQAPAAEIAAEVDRTAPGMPQAGSLRTLFYLEVAQAMVGHEGQGESAVAYARKAVEAIPPDETRPEVRAYAGGVLGRALLAQGKCEPAIESLRSAVGVLPDSQSVLFTLGAAYEQCGNTDLAIDHYVRSLGVYGGLDSSAAAPLRALYAKQHGSLTGLDRKIDTSYQASLEKEVFESRRYEAAMPEWSLENTAGDTVHSDDLAGKVVVLDFWGSWCGPCRMELPHFQSIYEAFQNRGVVFYGVNMERAEPSQHKALAVAYMQQNGFDFPNVYDIGTQATAAFRVEAFPTVFLIDASGRIRYRNIGFSDQISDIMTRQIESLIKEQRKGEAAKK